MEKQLKPLPNDERLKYHGTAEKPDIKIFVSHRIDLDSEIIDNPLYIPVRCGAVYDERENVTMFGDDTGENISEKRMTFCEYTVMYWAWKNIKADYYGLAHYRRYLSFSKKEFHFLGQEQCVWFDSMAQVNLDKAGLTQEFLMEEEIKNVDAVVGHIYDIRPDVKDVEELWLGLNPFYLKDEELLLLFDLVKELSPEYYDDIIEMSKGKEYLGFNCFIMKADMFNEMCEFMFPVLFAFEEKLSNNNKSMTQKRAPGYAGEWLYTAFVFHQLKKRNIIQKHLVFFQDTERKKIIKPVFEKNTTTVVFSCNDFNRGNVSVCIQSIIDNASSKNNYDLIILRRSYDVDKYRSFFLVREDNTIVSMAEEYSNISIRLFDPKDYIGSLECNQINKNLSEEQYYILFLDRIFAEFEKVIYCDYCTVFTDDVAKINEIVTYGKYCAAPTDMYTCARLNGFYGDWNHRIKEERKFLDKIENPYELFSSALVAFNLSEIRQNKVLEDFADIDFEKDIKSKKDISDYLNYKFQGKVELLPQWYNKRYCIEPYWFQFMDCVPEKQMKELKDSRCVSINLLDSFDVFNVNAQTEIGRLYLKVARTAPLWDEMQFNVGQYFVPNYLLLKFEGVQKKWTVNNCFKSLIKKIIFHLPFGKKIWNGMKIITQKIIGGGG